MMWTPLVVGTMILGGFMISNNLGFGCAICSFSSMCCSYFFWFVFGMVWRFNDYGRFASGAKIPDDISETDWHKQIHDHESIYQTASGQFMKLYYIISFIVILTPIVIAILTLLMVWCAAGTAQFFLKNMSEGDNETIDV